MTLKNDISAILYRHDPMGLVSSSPPTDEYDSEAELIIKGMENVFSIDECTDMIRTVFATRFSLLHLGPRKLYVQIAYEICERYHPFTM